MRLRANVCGCPKPSVRCYTGRPGDTHTRQPTDNLKLVARVLLVCGVACGLCTSVVAQGSSREAAGEAQPAASEINPDASAAPVEIDGRTVLSVYSTVGGFTPEERADHIRSRILEVAQRRDIEITLIHAEDRGVWTEILAGDQLIMGITEYDARIVGRPRAQLAAEYAEIIRQVVKQYRLEHTWRNTLRAAGYSALTTSALFLLLIILFRIYRRMNAQLRALGRPVGPEEPMKSVSSRMLRFLGRGSFELGRILSLVMALTLLQVYVTLILSFFPATRNTSDLITHWLFSELVGLARHFLEYLPNLFVVTVICLAGHYLIRLNRYLFGEIRDEKLNVEGFYPEWAEPTAKIVRVAIVAATAIVVFPYLPGSGSPAFRGITVFLGVLLSLGSSSAVAHAVAGIILTYMRSFRVGDFVKIGDTVGDVVEKTILVTRICTQKNEMVTIPSGNVLGGIVVNYSAQARERGVIFYTRVTIGYSVPWRIVHDLLNNAALSTKDILSDPKPFVLQHSLDDFYVSYELNSFTAHPENMQNIYSQLHENIQDKFHEAGIEINSPHYAAIRDGSRTAIPDEYLPKNYKAPGFNLNQNRESTKDSGKS
jgi:small-conductance mechanosensitive channel